MTGMGTGPRPNCVVDMPAYTECIMSDMRYTAERCDRDLRMSEVILQYLHRRRHLVELDVANNHVRDAAYMAAS